MKPIRRTATIIFYRDAFGFARPDEEGPNIFVSDRELVKSGIKGDFPLVAGQRIGFDVVQGTKGPRAINITLL